MAEGRRREVYDPDNMLLIAFEVADAGGFIHRKEKHRRPGVGYYLIKMQCQMMVVSFCLKNGMI